MKNKLRCLFGHHNYTIPNKDNPDILICGVCKRFGYRKYFFSGFEEWYEYDKKGNRIHFKDSSGREEWYDGKGNLTHIKYSSGNEEWYDEKGNEIHYKDSDGYEVWYEYDEKGNEIHLKYPDGFEEWRKYDEKGNEIYSKDSDGYETWFDEEGNIIKQIQGTLKQRI